MPRPLLRAAVHARLTPVTYANVIRMGNRVRASILSVRVSPANGPCWTRRRRSPAHLSAILFAGRRSRRRKWRSSTAQSSQFRQILGGLRGLGGAASRRRSRARRVCSPHADLGAVNRRFAPRPLAQSDDRIRFDCGHLVMNAWFHATRGTIMRPRASRVNVIDDVDTRRIVGYVTLSAAQIERSFLPKSRQRNQPDPVPVTLLGQLAVDRAFQGQGTHRSCIRLAAALKPSESVAARPLSHILSTRACAVLRALGLSRAALRSSPRMILRMLDIQQRLKIAPGSATGPLLANSAQPMRDLRDCCAQNHAA